MRVSFHQVAQKAARNTARLTGCGTNSRKQIPHRFSGTVNFCRPQIRTLLAITLAAAEAAVVAVSFFQIFRSTAGPDSAVAVVVASAAVSFAAADSVAAGLAVPAGSRAVLRRRLQGC